nr:protein 3B [Theilovirus]
AAYAGRARAQKQALQVLDIQ